ncbi:MAG: endonuclease/exonuclease/phosphatase family protein [Planctomycetes bacterium]|nr:endonuclease/exonuclease/phosphatase family protein [Planctomycetota bacterium]
MTEITKPIAGSQRSRLRRWLLPPREQRKRLFALEAWLVVIASYVAIIFAVVFPQDFRTSLAAYVRVATAAFMIRTFLFHLGLLLCAIAIGAAVIRRWRLLIAASPLVILCVGSDVWSYVPKSKPAIAGQSVTVMSANLLGRNQDTAALVAEVVGAKPDVLLLHEYRPHWHRTFQSAVANDYPYVDYVQRRDDFGLAVYSRLPFVTPVDTAIALGTGDTPQARVVVQSDGRDVAVYSVHLMPPKNRAYTTRQRQEFADLLELLKREELPIVLCGDFNFTNASAFADELARLGLIDAHRISGWGRGSTWPVLGFFRYVPGVRIDHVFLSRELTSTSSRTGIGHGSDHRPVIAEIGFAH